MASTPIRDFVYLDVERLRSIVAQLEKGLVDTLEESAARDTEIDAKIEGSLLRVLRGAGGSRFLWQRETSETRTLHDYLFTRVEEGLLERKVLARMPEEVSAAEASPQTKGGKLTETSFLLARGHVTLNDFGRMKSIVGSFNELGKFLAYCSVAALEGQHDQKTIHRHRKEAEKSMQVSKELQNGLQLVMDSFYRDRVVVKLSPYSGAPAVKLVGNLRPEYLREDSETLIYKYGTTPRAPWVMMAQVAAMPPDEEPELPEHHGSPGSVEAGFERMFDSVRAMEAMLKPIVHPEISVTPVALYRE